MMQNNTKAFTLDEKVINRSGINFFHLFNAWFEVKELEFLAESWLMDIPWFDWDYVTSIVYCPEQKFQKLESPGTAKSDR